MSHSALQNPAMDDDRPSLAPIQNELLAALNKISPPLAAGDGANKGTPAASAIMALPNHKN
jgi:hypothetical protein